LFFNYGKKSGFYSGILLDFEVQEEIEAQAKSFSKLLKIDGKSRQDGLLDDKLFL